jgi:uncharacterized damage-inducible protein DinB
MDSEVGRIDDQILRMFEGDAWHGPSVTAALSGVDAARAAARPLPNGHSIWELVLHMGVWMDIPRRRVSEGRAIEATRQEDWPQPPEPTEEAWKQARENLQRSYRSFRGWLSGLDVRRLEETVPGRSHDLYTMLHGVVQHLAYHAGQISLLKKG